MAPFVALGGLALVGAHDEALKSWPVDALVVTEAVAIAACVNQIVKFSFGRERPIVHALASAEKLTAAQPSDNNTSFYSGHTSLAFSLAVAAGTVATMRGYRWAPYIWVSGLVVAGTTGYLRIAGDRHYATDVLAAATVGSALGFAVPFLFIGRWEVTGQPSVRRQCLGERSYSSRGHRRRPASPQEDYRT